MAGFLQDLTNSIHTTIDRVGDDVQALRDLRSHTGQAIAPAAPEPRATSDSAAMPLLGNNINNNMLIGIVIFVGALWIFSQKST